MDLRQFENVMKSFFNKAGVTLLKKGVDYDDINNISSYILLDTKRNSYYLTEINVNNPENIEDLEVKALLDDFSSNNGIGNLESNAILSLGKALSNYDSSFSLKDADLNNLIKKSALIITEDNVDNVKSYLDKNFVKYQAAPLKGAFVVLFIDKAPSLKLSEIFKSVENSLINESTEKSPTISFDDIMKHVEPVDDSEHTAETGQSISFDDIMKHVEPVETSELEIKKEEKGEKAPTISFDDIMKDIEPVEESKINSNASMDNEDKLLNELDLSFMQKKAEDIPEANSKEEELLYSNVINEQVAKATNTPVPAPAPKERDAKEVPQDILDSVAAEDVVDVKETHKKEEKAKKEKKVKEKRSSNRGFKGSISLIFQHFVSIIFFTPAYIVKRITKNILPPFVVYWIFAITVFFGLYDVILSLFSPILYFNSDSNIQEMSSIINSIFSKKEIVINNDTHNLFLSSLGFFSGLSELVNILTSTVVIKYIMVIGAVLMIFPVFRKLGSRITVSALLLFFTMPLLIYIDKIFINKLFSSLSINQISQLSFFSFFGLILILLIFIAIIFWFSKYIYTDKLKENEVLPWVINVH